MSLRKPKMVETTVEATEVAPTEANAVAPSEPSQPSDNAVAVSEVATTEVATTEEKVVGLRPYDAENPDQDMTMRYGSIPKVVLSSGQFSIADEEIDLGTEFLAMFRNSYMNFLYVNDDKEDGEDGKVFWHDQEDPTTITDAKLLEQLEDWRSSGESYTVKPYRFVTAMIVDGDSAGTTVILSLPFTADTKYRGYYLQLSFRNLNTNQVVTRIAVGKKKLSKLGKTYTPWTFKYHSRADEFNMDFMG